MDVSSSRFDIRSKAVLLDSCSTRNNGTIAQKMLNVPTPKLQAAVNLIQKKRKALALTEQ